MYSMEKRKILHAPEKSRGRARRARSAGEGKADPGGIRREKGIGGKKTGPRGLQPEKEMKKKAAGGGGAKKDADPEAAGCARIRVRRKGRFYFSSMP